MTDVLLGIDTGGTYTDGVLLDYQTRSVLKKIKTLTTKDNLLTCILNALDSLLPEDPGNIQLVSISTTLATNAIAEGKRKPVALFLLGYDESLIKNFNFESHFGTPQFFFIEGGHNLEGKPQAQLDVKGLLEAAKNVRNNVDAVAISGYFSPLNTAHEELAARAVDENIHLPYVLGTQLSNKLNSIQRATTATLNASLLSPLNAFIQSIDEALRIRNIQAPLMIMHSDGSLMDAEKVKSYPIETVHSGPAASAVGARFLAKVDKALVIDIGGTTTDIAVIDKGRVTINETGTRVGEYNTAVRAADIRSIGLGGDSMLALGLEDQIQIGPERVTPLSYLAHKYSHVQPYLQNVSRQFKKNLGSPNNLEFWYLLREPKRFIENENARRVIKLLQESPLPLPLILDKLELFHQMQFDGQGLIREEIVGRAALTPTDLFHITGEYAPWNQVAAELAAAIFTRLIDFSVDDLIKTVKEKMAETITEEIVTFLTRQPLERFPSYVPLQNLGAWLFEENLTQKSPYLGSQIKLKMPLIGIGAPAGLLLPRVAEMLHTDLILPEHYEVANAIGAVVGGVIETKEAWVYPKLRNTFPVGYIVQTEKVRKVFHNMEEAVAFAKDLLKEETSESVQQSGAEVNDFEIFTFPEGAESCRIRVTAIGVPKI